MVRVSLLVVLAGCAPVTPYRQALFTVPVTPPVALGAPLAPGEVGLGAYYTHSALGLGDLVAEVDDPALHIAPYALGGHVRAGVLPWLELGASGDWADASWSARSSPGVLDIPGRQGAWGVGAHALAGRRWGPSGLGVTLDVEVLSLPYAQYVYTGPPEYLDPASPDYHCCDDLQAFYTPYERDVAHPVRVRGGVAYDHRIGLATLGGGLVVAPTLTNNGFSTEPEPPYVAGAPAFGPVLFLGVDPGPVHVGVQGWYLGGTRAATNGLDHGFGGRLSVEARFGRPEADQGPPSAFLSPRTSTMPVATLMP